MTASLLMGIWGNIILYHAAYADGDVVTISRSDSISNQDIAPYAVNTTWVSFQTNSIENLNYSIIRIFATNQWTVWCTTGSDIEWIISKVWLYHDGILLGEDTTTSEFIWAETSCVYEIAVNSSFNSGIQSFDIVYDTITTWFVVEGANVSFVINQDSFPWLQTDMSVPVITSDIAGSVTSAQFTSRNPGIDTISILNIANPQLEYDNGIFTGMAVSIMSKSVSDIILSRFVVQQIGTNKFGSDGYDVTNTVTLYDDSWTILATTAIVGTWDIIFSNLNLNILAGQTQNLHMMLAYSGSIVATNFRFGASYWDVQDMSGYNYPYNVSIQGNQIDILANSSVGLNTVNSPSSSYNNNITNPLYVGQVRLVSTSPTVIEQLSFINLNEPFYATTVNTGTLWCSIVQWCSTISTWWDGLTVYLVHSGMTVGTTIISGGVAMIDLDIPVTMFDIGQFFDIYVYDADGINNESETNKVVKLWLLDTQNTLDHWWQNVETIINKVPDNNPIPAQFDNLIYNTHRVRATTISLINLLIPNTGANNLLSVDDQTGAVLFQTMISAYTTRDTSIHGITFDHAVYGVAVSNYNLTINGLPLAPWDLECSTTSTTVTCIFSGSYIDGYTIPAWWSHTIELIADTTTSSSTGDYITTSLNQWAANDFGIYTAADAITTDSSIVWSDNAAVSLTTASINWFTDAGITTLPSSSRTFVRDGGWGWSCGNGATNYPACDDNQIILTNLWYTQDNGDTNLYLVTRDPYLTGSASVDVYVRNNTLSGEYQYISPALASDGQAYVYFDIMASYTVKLIPADSFSVPLWPEQTIIINHTINIPVITLNGSGIITIEAGDNYTDSGAIYSDVEDGTGSVITNDTVNHLLPWTYTLNYNHTDNGGNAAVTVTRTVIVQDTTAPIITLNGGSTTTVLLSGTYTELWASWTDIVDGSGSTVVSGYVDVYIVWDYLLEYTYTDLAGNSGTWVSRTVMVSTGNTPSLVLNGSGTITQPALTWFVDPGALWTDIEDGSGLAIISWSVNTGILWTYTLYYDYIDLQGNIAPQLSRTVIITEPTCDPGTELYTWGSIVSCNSCAAGSYNDQYGWTCILCPAGTFAASEQSSSCQTCPSWFISTIWDTMCSDIQAPTIILSGSSTIVIPQWWSYTEYGAKWTDNGDGTGDAFISWSVNTSVIWTYTIEYYYNDNAGNMWIPQFRAVYVVDQTIPIITINGSSSVIIEAGDSYTDSGAHWSDNVDGTGNIVASGTVNTLLPWVYTLTYDYTDTSTNSAIQQVRTVTVQDTTAPLVMLSGWSSIIIAVNDIFIDPGASYSDVVLWTWVIATASSRMVSTTTTGEHILEYIIADAAGNVWLATRTVYVIAWDTPLVLVNGSGTMEQEVHTPYIELGAMWMDTEDGTGTNVNISGVVNTWIVGTYIIEYRYTDTNSNISIPAIRTVVVQDTIAPIITLNGSTWVVIAQWSSYTDAGAMWSDNADGTGVVLVSGSVDASVVGNYLLNYQHIDLAGNLSNIISRIVNVTDQTAPSITLVGTWWDVVLWSWYTEQGALWIDNVDGSWVTMPFTWVVDINTTGSYILYYQITDIAGNTSIMITRTINVVDEIIVPISISPPIISSNRVTWGGGSSARRSSISPDKDLTHSSASIISTGTTTPLLSWNNTRILDDLQVQTTTIKPPQEIVTIKIGEDGRIIVIRPWENNKQPIVAKDLARAQEVIMTGSVNQTWSRSDQAIQLKPYRIITAEMLARPRMLLEYQPTRDAAPRQSRWRLSSLLKSWD